MRKTLGIFVFVTLISLLSVFALENPANAEVLASTNGSLITTDSVAVTIDASNVTLVNLKGNRSTYKWAAFYGNASGNISLGWDNDILYDFSASAGSVFATTSNSFDWSNMNAGTAADVDTQWHAGSFGLSDNATSHFTSTATIATVATVPYVTTNGAGAWQSGIFDDGAAVAAKGDMAFGVDISSGTDFRGGVSDFQLMVPVDTGMGNTEIYYMYVVLD